jgi:hypothetical protein
MGENPHFGHDKESEVISAPLLILAVIARPASGGFYPPMPVVAIPYQISLRDPHRAASLSEATVI